MEFPSLPVMLNQGRHFEKSKARRVFPRDSTERNNAGEVEPITVDTTLDTKKQSNSDDQSSQSTVCLFEDLTLKAIGQEPEGKAQTTQSAAATLRVKRDEIRELKPPKAITDPGTQVPETLRISSMDVVARKLGSRKPPPGKSPLRIMWTPETIGPLKKPRKPLMELIAARNEQIRQREEERARKSYFSKAMLRIKAKVLGKILSVRRGDASGREYERYLLTRRTLSSVDLSKWEADTESDTWVE